MTEAEIISCHLRTGDRAAVLDALREVAGCGAPLEVWPPRPLPPGIFISPERYGWISLWGMPQACDALIPGMTATLECAGVVYHLVEEDYWLMEISQDGRRGARLSSPAEVLERLERYEEAWESLAAAGVDDPDADEGLLRDRMAAVRPEPSRGEDSAEGALRPLLPAGASFEEARSLLRAWDRAVSGDGDPESPAFIEDALETFANYLGIRDAAWDPRSDIETLSLGEYEDCEGLPEGWERFLLAPQRRWDLQVV
jgi:hypothetical protein